MYLSRQSTDFAGSTEMPMSKQRTNMALWGTWSFAASPRIMTTTNIVIRNLPKLFSAETHTIVELDKCYYPIKIGVKQAMLLGILQHHFPSKNSMFSLNL